MATSTSRTGKAVSERTDRVVPALAAATRKLADSPVPPGERRPNPVPVELPREGVPAALASFELGARRLCVVCVDDIVPMHVAARTDARARLVYAPGEVAHFELDGHRYSILREEERSHDARARDGASLRAGDDYRERLTNRELQIVQLISMGCLTKQVSDRLHISEFTVRSYVKTIYCKLGVRSRGALVYRYAQSFKRRGAPP